MKKLLVCDRLSLEEIDVRIRKCGHPKEVTRWLAIRMMKSMCLSANQVAKKLGFSYEAVIGLIINEVIALKTSTQTISYWL